jgi:ABC-type multidrug transport system ATPase subunit
MTGTLVQTHALTKRFGRVTAVEDVHLEVKEGDLFGFLGPNGSGKTTTVRMLLGLVYPTSGEMQLLGRPMPRDARVVLPEVGALIEGPAFYPHLSGVRNLALFDAAGPRGNRKTRKRRITDALDRVGLARDGRRAVKAYSSGMRQRLGLAAALLRPHRLLVLDEPTNGLDPRGMQEIRDLLLGLTSDGTTVLLSSHLLTEVEAICNRAAIIHEGHLVASDEVSALLAPTGRVWIDTPDPEIVLEVARRTPEFSLADRDAHRVAIHLDGLSPEDLSARLHQEGVRIREFLVERPTLEQLYLKLTEGSSGVRS